MCNSNIVKSVGRQVRPLLSLDKAEARRRVLNLYKAWYRQLPYIGKQREKSKRPDPDPEPVPD